MLIHGWGIHSYLWRRNIPALVAAGRRVFALDLPGHGLSERPHAPGSYTVGALSAHVTAAMDALGVRRAPLIAQSMGGRVAVDVALTHAERVSGLALFGSAGFGEVFSAVALAPKLRAPRGALSTVLARRWMVAMARTFAYGKRGKPAAEDIDAFWSATQFPDYLAALHQALVEFDWRPLSSDVIGAIAAPTLVVFGTRDRTVRPVNAESLVAALPRGRLYWVRDAGHVANEEAADEVNHLLVQFVNEIG
jgi:pimeloyl-ACP methyl ester carboxylesterase